MEKKNKWTLFNKPSTTTEVATFDFTEQQKKEVQKLANEWYETKASIELKERKYFVADDEAVSSDAKKFIKNNILQSSVKP
jgi:hypothetical protein